MLASVAGPPCCPVSMESPPRTHPLFLSSRTLKRRAIVIEKRSFRKACLKTVLMVLHKELMVRLHGILSKQGPPDPLSFGPK